MTDTEIVRKAKTPLEHLLYWKLALIKVSGKCFLAIAISIAQALNGTEWSAFTDTQKFLAIVAAAAAGWTVVDAFIDSTMSELKKKDDVVNPPPTVVNQGQ